MDNENQYRTEELAAKVNRLKHVNKKLKTLNYRRTNKQTYKGHFCLFFRSL